jgi:(p)ppGpp synthase/HD superfamily hydrolase
MQKMKEYIKKTILEAIDKRKTINFIKRAHSDQKYGNMPYWKHPVQVAETGVKIFGSKFDNVAYVAALLHDVIEDTEYDREKLSELGYSDDILDAVVLLSKERSFSYEENIKRIINSGNRIAMMVKFADNYVNYTGDKSDWPAPKREKSQAKYKWSMESLGAKLGVEEQKYPF